MPRIGRVLVSAVLLTGIGSSTHPAREVQERVFSFRYNFELEKVPPETKQIRLRFPFPQDSTLQDVENLRNNLYLIKEQEGTYGNSVFYMEASPAKIEKVLFVSFHVARRAYPDPDASKGTRRIDAEELKRWLREPKEGSVSADFAQQAAALAGSSGTDLEKANALYRWVLGQPPADPKQQTTSSTFVKLCRAIGIPARAVLGFKLPDARGEGLLAGYRTWAEFFIAGTGWVPVDFEDHTFGTLSAHRVQFSVGSGETTSQPAPEGPVYPFIHPWVEIDGKRHTALRVSFSYQDRDEMQR